MTKVCARFVHDFGGTAFLDCGCILHFYSNFGCTYTRKVVYGHTTFVTSFSQLNFLGEFLFLVTDVFMWSDRVTVFVGRRIPTVTSDDVQ